MSAGRPTLLRRLRGVRPGFWVLALLAGLFLRGVTPVGYMPGVLAGSGALVECPMHAAGGDHGGGAHHRAFGCWFGTLVPLSVAGALPAPFRCVPLRPGLECWGVAGRPLAGAAPAFRARAPPSFS